MDRKMLFKLVVTKVVFLIFVLLLLTFACTPKPTSTQTLAPVTAQSKPIELKVSTHMTPISIFHQPMEWWTKEMEKATNGRVKFTIYTGGTLIDQNSSYTELLAGTADICYTSSLTNMEHFPIGVMLHQCFYGADRLKVIPIMQEVMKNFPDAAKEWSRVKTLTLMGPGPSNFHTREPIRSLDSLKGKQIWVSGQWGVQSLKKLGVVPVSIPNAEVYSSLEKGIIDGTMAPMDALRTFKYAEVISYTTYLYLQSAPSSRQIMNLDSFNRLPTDIQKIFEDSLPKLQERFLEMAVAGDEEAMKFAKGLGDEFIELPSEDLKTFFNLLDDEARTAVAKVDAKGLPGTKIFQFVRQQIEKGN